VQFFYAGTSLVDPLHFGTDPDPDPRICRTDLRIRVLLEILLFSSVTFKMPTINNFFLTFFLLTFLRYIYIILQREKVIKKEVTNE
jgi:hypothetical protein